MSVVSLAPALGLWLGLLSPAEASQRETALPASVAPAPSLAALPDDIAIGLLTADTHAVLDELDIEAAVTARVKSPQSLAAKAARKGKAPEQILDRLALRVRVDEIDDCYTILDHIQARFTPVEGAADDYIAHPKANGYQSLHTAVHTPVGVAEFQIRTHAMHHHAEHGAAAHSLYKALQASA